MLLDTTSLIKFVATSSTKQNKIYKKCYTNTCNIIICMACCFRVVTFWVYWRLPVFIRFLVYGFRTYVLPSYTFVRLLCRCRIWLDTGIAGGSADHAQIVTNMIERIFSQTNITKNVTTQWKTLNTYVRKFVFIFTVKWFRKVIVLEWLAATIIYSRPTNKKCYVLHAIVL